jgi:hypothetical protein
MYKKTQQILRGIYLQKIFSCIFWYGILLRYGIITLGILTSKFKCLEQILGKYDFH